MTQSQEKTHFILVQTTLEKLSDAEKIAHTLIEKHLCACVQITNPVTSIYQWQQQIQVAREHILSGKTTRVLWPDVQDQIKRLHPYELPELIAVPISAISIEYSQWLQKQCS